MVAANSIDRRLNSMMRPPRLWLPFATFSPRIPDIRGSSGRLAKRN
jgi:hypothetical protein